MLQQKRHYNHLTDAQQFEQLIHKYLGKASINTYAEHWDDDTIRVALLYTLCGIAYNKTSSAKVGDTLSGFMDQLFKDKANKNTSIACLHYLSTLD
jgi:hypothetical protein